MHQRIFSFIDLIRSCILCSTGLSLDSAPMLGRVPDKEPCVAKDTRADQVNGRENTLVCLPCAREWKRTSSLRVVGEVEPQEWKQILIWSNAVIGEVEPEHLLPGESVIQAARRNMYDFRLYLEELVRECRENGAERGGMIDRMVHTKVQGKHLTDQQLIGFRE